MSEFKIPPISTLIGSNIKNYFEVIKKGRIEAPYYFKLILSTIVVFIAEPFHWYEELVFRNKLKNFKNEKEPLFILGHWRSGTTLLHNVLCQDPEAAYLTTYHALFPNNLASKALFKTFMRINMPDKRPSDNVKLNINYPQEDEFSVGNSNPHSYYNFFYFPENYQECFDQAVEFNLPQLKYEQWKDDYKKLITKAILNTKGKRAIIKNPVNTGRIKTLLELYPNAKFLYISRDPVAVYLSSKKFFTELIPTLTFQHASKEFIDQMILEIYPKIMHRYEEQKDLIPKENLMEIQFESFKDNSIEYLEKIYTQLLGEPFEKVKPIMEQYLGSLKGYKKNKYEVDPRIVEKITKDWGLGRMVNDK